MVDGRMAGRRGRKGDCKGDEGRKSNCKDETRQGGYIDKGGKEDTRLKEGKEEE